MEEDMNKIKFSRTLLVAALALTIMLSVTGGTIAWFTDEVTSANNIIKSGNLDVEMYWADGKVAVAKKEADAILEIAESRMDQAAQKIVERIVDSI